MKLLTKALAKKLPALYSQDGKGEDAIAQVKFFSPDGQYTWWATEFCPEEGRFFGLVQGQERELGYFMLSELETTRGPMGLKIERDMHWSPRPLSECR